MTATALTLSQPLTQLPAPSSLTEIQMYANLFAESGMFLDARQMAQAAVRILAGSELGIRPFAAMVGICIISGKTTLTAGLMATVIKRSGRYSYRVTEHDKTVCRIQFTENGELCGESEFTLTDAIQAGLDNKDIWKRYPKNMLFARALSNGARWYCADCFGGPIYTPEELGANVNEEGEIIEVEFVKPVSVYSPPPAPPEPTEAENATQKACHTARQGFWLCASRFGILPAALDDAQCDAWLSTLLAHPIPVEFTAATWKTLGSGMRAYGRMASANADRLEPAFILRYVQRTWKEVGSLLQMSNGMWQGVIGMIEEEEAERTASDTLVVPELLMILDTPEDASTPVELQTPGAFK